MSYGKSKYEWGLGRGEKNVRPGGRWEGKRDAFSSSDHSDHDIIITSTIPWLAVLVLTRFHCTEDLSKSAWCRICLERDRSLTGKG